MITTWLEAWGFLNERSCSNWDQLCGSKKDVTGELEQVLLVTAGRVGWGRLSYWLTIRRCYSLVVSACHWPTVVLDRTSRHSVTFSVIKGHVCKQGGGVQTMCDTIFQRLVVFRGNTCVYRTGECVTCELSKLQKYIVVVMRWWF